MVVMVMVIVAAQLGGVLEHKEVSAYAVLVAGLEELHHLAGPPPRGHCQQLPHLLFLPNSGLSFWSTVDPQLGPREAIALFFFFFFVPTFSFASLLILLCGAPVKVLCNLEHQV